MNHSEINKAYAAVSHLGSHVELLRAYCIELEKLLSDSVHLDPMLKHLDEASAHIHAATVGCEQLRRANNKQPLPLPVARCDLTRFDECVLW